MKIYVDKKVDEILVYLIKTGAVDGFDAKDYEFFENLINKIICDVRKYS